MIIVSLSAIMKSFQMYSVFLILDTISMYNKNVNKVIENAFNCNILPWSQICGNIKLLCVTKD